MLKRIKKILQNWLLSDYIEENRKEQKAQWNNMCDLREQIITIQQYGLGVKFKEIDLGKHRYYNSMEGNEVGTRTLIGYITPQGQKMVQDYKAKEYGLSIEEAAYYWEDLPKTGERKHYDL